MTTDRVYRCRMEGWLVAAVFGAALLPAAAGLVLLGLGQHRGVMLLLAWGTVMPAALALVSLPVRYTLRADRLQIQSGFLDWEVPYALLRGASPSRSPLPGPAWSWHRVRLDLADGSRILVSPDGPELFIQDLAGRCPHLRPASVSPPAPP